MRQANRTRSPVRVPTTSPTKIRRAREGREGSGGSRGQQKTVLKAPIDRPVGHLRRPHRLKALAPEALDLIEPQSRGDAQNTTAYFRAHPASGGTTALSELHRTG